MDEHLDDELLAEMGPDRRAFIKRMAATVAFAAPFVASFDMTNAGVSAAHAATRTPHQVAY